nr:hypothetical protein TetV2_00048 [Oceanusvirus sp.]
MERLTLVALYDDGGEKGRRSVAAIRHSLGVLKSAGTIRFKYVRPSKADTVVEGADIIVFFAGTNPGEDRALLHSLQGGKTIRVHEGKLAEDQFRITVDGVTLASPRTARSPSLYPVFTNRIREVGEEAPVLVLHQATESSVNPACRLWTYNLVSAAKRAGRDVVFRTANPALALERYRGLIRISEEPALSKDVDRSFFVASYSSTDLLIAACRRVPVVCAEGDAKPCSSDMDELLDYGRVDLPYAADVHDCLRNVAADQWSLEEIRSGEAFQRLFSS